MVSSEPPPGEIEKREAVISYGEDISKGDWKATHVGHPFDLCQSAFEPLLFCAYGSFQDILLETDG